MCGSCGYKLDAPPPPPSYSKAPARSRTSGGGPKILILAIPLVLLGAAGGTVAYFGVDRSLAYAQSFYQTAPPPQPKSGGKPSVQEERKKALDAFKSDASECFTQFNTLMQKGRPVAAGALKQSYDKNLRMLSSVTAAGAGCGDTTTADAIKLDLCDTVAQLKSCLTTVIGMQREHLAVTPGSSR